LRLLLLEMGGHLQQLRCRLPLPLLHHKPRGQW
jgi:hypothetical protein